MAMAFGESLHMPPRLGFISKEKTDVASDRVAGKSFVYLPGVTRP